MTGGERVDREPVHVVIGDIHARWARCRELLAMIGVLELVDPDEPMSDRRRGGFRLHQLGDVVSLGYGEVEADFLAWWLQVVEADDVLLLGNHELPAIWFDASMDFVGYEDRDEAATQVVRGLHAAGRYRAASSVGRWLLVHAGLAVRWQHELGLEGASAHEVAARLDAELARALAQCTPGQLHHPICGKATEEGGIFWERWAHLSSPGQAGGLAQVVGHTAVGPARSADGRLWLLDAAAIEPAGSMQRSSWGAVAALAFEEGVDSPPTPYLADGRANAL